MNSQSKAFSKYKDAHDYCVALATKCVEVRAIYAALGHVGGVAYYVGTVRQLKRRFGAGVSLVLVEPYRKVNKKESERREIYVYYCNLRGANAIKRTAKQYDISDSSVYRIIREFSGRVK